MWVRTRLVSSGQTRTLFPTCKMGWMTVPTSVLLQWDKRQTIGSYAWDAGVCKSPCLWSIRPSAVLGRPLIPSCWEQGCQQRVAGPFLKLLWRVKDTRTRNVWNRCGEAANSPNSWLVQGVNA